MLPNFLVIGFMRSGTSALFHGATNHPDVFGAPGKEVHFFDRHYERGLDWYESVFAGAENATAVGEGTPYLDGDRAIERLVSDLPGARFIAIVRQPADRAYSHYWHNRRRGREERPFLDAFESDLAGEIDRSTSPLAYWWAGLYARHLERLLRTVPASRLHVLLNEDLREDRERALREVWAYIGVDPDRGQLETRSRPTHRKVIRSVKNLVKGRTDDRGYPAIDPMVRDRLTALYEDDILRLQDLTKRDLSGWLVRRG